MCVTLSRVCLPCTESSINTNTNGAAANGDIEVVGGGGGGGGGGKTAKLTSNAWCVCRWLISCMKKDEPAIGATTFQNSTPNTPQVYISFFSLVLSLPLPLSNPSKLYLPLSLSPSLHCTIFSSLSHTPYSSMDTLYLFSLFFSQYLAMSTLLFPLPSLLRFEYVNLFQYVCSVTLYTNILFYV